MDEIEYAIIYGFNYHDYHVGRMRKPFQPTERNEHGRSREGFRFKRGRNVV
ncbi:hypothetical protein J23TS9_12640 [Paenibacillus sp. J23TS9]|nr:hypothetical protein J23TS9_12640 [Paenibacillus sp. J23TS9]